VRQDIFMEGESGAAPPGLKGGRCGSCGKVTFPLPTICPGCRGEMIDPTPLSTQGRVFEWTTVWKGAPGFTAPYHVGYVDLPEGIRLFTQFELEANESLDHGQEVVWSAALVRSDGTNNMYSYAFRRPLGVSPNT
jgi:uncharacterized OB-fold protein